METVDFEAEKTYVKDFINNNCIARVPKGSLALPSKCGTTHYRWQFYLRAALFNPVVLHYVVTDFWNMFGEQFKKEKFQLVGVESASTPIITAIVLDFLYTRGLVINAFSIRKERKPYGLKNIIEGRPTDDPIIFIDDLTSPTHATLWHTIKHLSESSLPEPKDAYVLVNKQTRPIDPIIKLPKGDMFVKSSFYLDDFRLF